MGGPRENYDDTDHLLGDLYLLNKIEQDPQLLAFYRKCVRDSWEAHQDERMSWYNFVYRSVLGEESSGTCADVNGTSTSGGTTCVTRMVCELFFIASIVTPSKVYMGR